MSDDYDFAVGFVTDLDQERPAILSWQCTRST
jgi:hypothetical protein